jgi:P pilus assembly chaperone PapD
MSLRLKTDFSTLFAIVLALSVVNAHAENAGLGLNPGRAEVEIMPGQEKTIGFQIDSPPSERPVRGHLLLTPTDWKIDTDTSVSYTEAGTLPDSAAKWMVFSPSAVSIESGQSQLVRVTVKVPGGTAPGVYRTGIFVQERPPATPPKTGEHLVMFRFRYLFSLYVIVQPVEGHGQFADLRSIPQRQGTRLIFELKNSGSRHVRPYIDATIRDSEGNVVASLRHQEATVLLPFATNNEPVSVTDLAPGRYEIEARIDFQDGRPVQAIKRVIEVPAS